MNLRKLIEALTIEEVEELKLILNESSVVSKVSDDDGTKSPEDTKLPPIGGGFPGDPFPQPKPEK